MKKLAKVLGVVATVGAVAAGGIAIYNKFFFSGEDDDDLDDAFTDDSDDPFDEEEMDFSCESPRERSYVSLTPSEDADKEESAEIPAEAIPIV